MIRPELVVFDIDGTLACPDGTISDRTREAVDLARRSGAHVALATGRRSLSAMPVARDLGVTLPVICFNGGLMVDPKTRETVRMVGLRERLARRVVLAIQGHGITALLYRHTPNPPDIFHQLDPSHPAVGSYLAREGENVGRVPDLCQECSGDVLRVMCFGDHDSIDQVRGTVEKQVSPSEAWTLSSVFRGLSHLEVFPPEVSKGKAVTELASRLEVPMSRVMTFGDGPNDVDLLEVAGTGVAMGNAVPETLRAADLVTASQAEDGVAVVLERVFGGISA